jgi:hypothetical protein
LERTVTENCEDRIPSFEARLIGVERMGRIAAGEPSPPIWPLTVRKKYADGLEMSCPGGVCFKLGP